MKTKFFTNYELMMEFTTNLIMRGRNMSVQSDSNGWTVNWS